MIMTIAAIVASEAQSILAYHEMNKRRCEKGLEPLEYPSLKKSNPEPERNYLAETGFFLGFAFGLFL